MIAKINSLVAKFATISLGVESVTPDLPYLLCYLSRGAEEQRNKNVICLNKSITTPKEPNAIALPFVSD
ncbi:hypothetical protein [Argonema galeatum]|uniref:hypothetical protein n=1 Tax=Argonema galeatum TaxID=2942762 RepID=UPI002010DC5D|nr:hypothetical protein [Argonema galeatum]MCL1467313.1 hypothetical protein [Argonema galeatum A003/A1]